MNQKIKVARLSIISNSFLIAMKLVVGLVSGSVSIYSEAIHSSLDMLASIIAFFSVKISDTPPDREHPYGHGKFENVSGVVEAILIFIAAGWIIYEATQRILVHKSIINLDLGIVVMLLSAILNAWVSRRLYKVARATDSIALEADALHLRTDVYTSLGVALGLLLIRITGLSFLDPVIAILVALFIIRESYILLKNAFSPLVDKAMANEEIESISNYFSKRNLSFHDLKTRKAGQFRFAELHLELPAEMTLKEVHFICDEIEVDLKARIANLWVNIHVEPLNQKE